MKHRVFGVTIYILLLILLLSGDSIFHSSSKYKKTTFAAAVIEVSSNMENMQAEPGKIPMEQSLKETPNTSTLTEADISSQIAKKLTLLTFNIRSANNANGSVELEKIIQEIKETEADIIGLQEVERMMPRSGYQDQARIIAEELGYHYYYGGNINILGVQYGNALLSKYPILNARNHKLPKEKLEPRGMIEADIDIDGLLWHVYVTHLGLNSEERNKQINYINQVISQRSANILLMGDFNNLPESLEMNILDKRMIDSAAALNCLDYYTFAWRNDTPNVRIDRIYASEDIDILDHEVKASAVSDHELVLTQISSNMLK